MNTTCPVLTDALLDRLRALSASFCLAEGGSHGPDHSERVLQTAAGREMAEQRHAFMETFFAQLTRETSGLDR